MLHSLLLIVLILCLATAVQAVEPPSVAGRLKDHLAVHPRLLLNAADEKALQKQFETDARLAKLRDHVLATADQALAMPPLERVLQGRRLLGVSRDAWSRIATLSLAYRLSHDQRYLAGATANLKALTAFEDFHPQHFLDVAEISAALAVGYDWLYADLSAEDRAAIRTAIVEKCLKASYMTPPDGWIEGHNNWTQVCHGGLTMAALAIADEEPELAAKIIERAVKNVPRAVKPYAPDGAYPEGAMYWEYGTTYNALMIAALRSAVGDDFGLSALPGFLKSAEFHLHVVGPSGKQFSYCDCTESTGVTAAAFYLAKLQNDPSLLFNEIKALDAHLAHAAVFKEGPYSFSYDWLTLIWTTGGLKQKIPTATHWSGGGETPVALHRFISWSPHDLFFGIHGGSPGGNHAHMDIGSFAIDWNGLRWAGDLGMQDYNSLESRGLNIWNMSQGSPRWQVFRIGPMSHNILTVNGQEQVVTGHAAIEKSVDAFTILNMTSVYAGQLSEARRGARFLTTSVRIQDEICAAPASAVKAPTTGPTTRRATDAITVRWAMLTTANVVPNGNRALLQQGGNNMVMVVRSPIDAAIRVVSTDPPHDYDAPNPGTRLVTFDVTLQPGQPATLAVDFEPGGPFPYDVVEPIVPMTKW